MIYYRLVTIENDKKYWLTEFKYWGYCQGEAEAESHVGGAALVEGLENAETLCKVIKQFAEDSPDFKPELAEIEEDKGGEEYEED